jgi:hypothetical protein
VKVELISSEGIFLVLAYHPKVPEVWYVWEKISIGGPLEFIISRLKMTLAAGRVR